MSQKIYDDRLRAMTLWRLYQAFGGEVTEAEVTENDLGGIKEVEGAAVLAAKEEGLSLHVDVGGVTGGCHHLVGEEYGRRVEVLAHAVAHHPSQRLYRLLPHLSPTRLFSLPNSKSK